MKKHLPIAFTAPAAATPAIRLISCVQVSNPDTTRSQSVMALWDLGAGISVLNKSVADRIGLQPYGKCKLTTAGGAVTSEVATASLQICVDGVAMEIHVAIIPDRNDESLTELTIGADVICRGCLSVFPDEDGLPQFSFAYPPEFGIDYHDFFNRLGVPHTNTQFNSRETH